MAIDLDWKRSVLTWLPDVVFLQPPCFSANAMASQMCHKGLLYSSSDSTGDGDRDADDKDRVLGEDAMSGSTTDTGDEEGDDEADEDDTVEKEAEDDQDDVDKIEQPDSWR